MSKLSFASMQEEMAKLQRQMKILEKQKSAPKVEEPEEPEESDEIMDEITDDDTDNIEVHSANDIDEGVELQEDVAEEPEATDELEPEEPIEEMPEETLAPESTNEIIEKLEKLTADFNKFKAKSISMLEAILAANRISIGLDKTETPRLTIEKKKEGTLNTASGKLKHEVAGLALWLNPEDASLKVTTKTVTISKGDAVEEQLEVKGKIPTGDWVIIERNNKYTLVSTENCTNLEDIEPYDNEDDNENGSSGIIVNKKGVANNVRGYELEPLDDCFKLTDRALNKPVKVFKAKWTNDCDNKWPVKGNVPEGTWVIVYNRDDDAFYLVKSDDVEIVASTKKTEEKKVVKKVPVKVEKKVVKKAVNKKPVKKIAKKVAKKK